MAEYINHYQLLVEAFQDCRSEIKVRFEFSYGKQSVKTNFLELDPKYHPLHYFAEEMPINFLYFWESARKYVQQETSQRDRTSSDP